MAKKKIIFIPGGWSKAEDCFSPQIKFLENDYKLIYPDIHGFNQIESMTDFIVNNYDSVFAVVGLSMGGFVALDILCRYPHFTKNAVLMGTFARPQLDEVKAFFHELLNKIKNKQIELAELCDMYAKDMVSDYDYLHNQQLKEKIKSMPLQFSEEKRTNHNEACINWKGCLNELKNIQANVLLLAGELDKAIPLADMKHLSHTIPNSTLHVIKNASHFMTLDHPEETNALVGDFLQAAANT